MFSLDTGLQQINLGSSSSQQFFSGWTLKWIQYTNISVRIQPQMCKKKKV